MENFQLIEKKVLTNHKYCGKIAKLIQMSGQLQQFTQFKTVKFDEKTFKKVLDIEK